jgi:hypothetical protein
VQGDICNSMEPTRWTAGKGERLRLASAATDLQLACNVSKHTISKRLSCRQHNSLTPGNCAMHSVDTKSLLHSSTPSPSPFRCSMLLTHLSPLSGTLPPFIRNPAPAVPQPACGAVAGCWRGLAAGSRAGATAAAHHTHRECLQLPKDERFGRSSSGSGSTNAAAAKRRAANRGMSGIKLCDKLAGHLYSCPCTLVAVDLCFCFFD